MYPHTVPLEVRSSTYEFRRGHNSVYSTGFSTDVLYLFQHPIQDTTLPLGVCAFLDLLINQFGQIAFQSGPTSCHILSWASPFLHTLPISDSIKLKNICQSDRWLIVSCCLFIYLFFCYSAEYVELPQPRIKPVPSAGGSAESQSLDCQGSPLAV